MADVRIRRIRDKAALERVLRGPGGPVVRDLLVRGERVASAARRNLERPPRRVDTGLLRASVRVTLVYVGTNPGANVGSPLQYARYVHDGTGIFGPQGHPVYPKRAQALRWESKKAGKVLYAKSVKGMEPNPFLLDALPAARS